MLKICGLPKDHAAAFADIMTLGLATDPIRGTVADAVIQRLFYTVTSLSLALREATTPPATLAPASPSSYAARLASQTNPLSQQTKTHAPLPTHTTATTRTEVTRRQPQDEVVLRTSLMSNPPTTDAVIQAATAAARGREAPIATRRLGSGDTAVVFPRDSDRWFIRDLIWARALGAEVSVTGPKVVVRRVPSSEFTEDLTDRVVAPCQILSARPMVRRGNTPPAEASVCLTVATQNDVNLLLNGYITIGHELYYPVPYIHDNRQQICNRCNVWGHQAKGCRKPLRCAHCGGPHASAGCQKPADGRQCPNCSGSHPAYSRTCVFSRRTGTNNNVSSGDVTAALADNDNTATNTYTGHGGGDNGDHDNTEGLEQSW